MTRHEIDIEGLPDGWEPVKATYIGAALGKTETHSLMLEMRRKVRKYRWEITLPDVLVAKSPQHVVFGLLGHQPPDAGMVIAPIWQPNIHGKCPVDGEACIVRVKRADGSEYTALANNITWEFTSNPILGWQFIRLVDGVEW
jgi:hypothetical protein